MLKLINTIIHTHTHNTYTDIAVGEHIILYLCKSYIIHTYTQTFIYIHTPVGEHIILYQCKSYIIHNTYTVHTHLYIYKNIYLLATILHYAYFKVT